MTTDPTIIPLEERQVLALERIAEALDSLAALHAAGPALKGTGAEPDLRFGAFFTNARDMVNAETFGTPDTDVSQPANPQAALYAQADGWIEWTGGVCPVDPHTKVDWKGRGWKGRDGICSTDAARDLNWTHKNNGDQIDIVAYRIRKDAQ